ncbi:MAG: amino acid ABC transporter substrate-binding protein [Verrucomicrobia bacterium]|nr:amino acid ABC transporter substrate-binding protein [Verrucomicrobiota bacterium]
MKSKWAFIISVGLIGIGSSMLFFPSHKYKSDKTLLVGTNAEFAPFAFVEDKKIIGFDIDVANEICKRLGKEMQLKDMPFDALISELALGHVDFVAAGMSHTEERAKRVLFTTSYLSGNPLVILTLGKPASLEDLLGKTVVVNEGYVADLFMTPKPGYNLVRLGVVTDGFLAVKSGRADAFITAKSTVGEFLQSHKEMPFQIESIPNTSESCCIAVSKQRAVLLPEIQAVLDDMASDGTLHELTAKWNLL